MKLTGPDNEEIVMDSLEDLVSYVFRSPTPDPETYQLLLDGATNERDIFRALGQILTHGMVYLYGEQVEVHELSERNISHLRGCFKAMGFDVLIDPNDDQKNQVGVIPHILSLPAPRGQTSNYVNVVFRHLK
jgi:hypothetical protein